LKERHKRGLVDINCEGRDGKILWVSGVIKEIGEGSVGGKKMEGVKLTLAPYEMINVNAEETVATSPPRNCGSHGNNEDTKTKEEQTIHFAPEFMITGNSISSLV
jgi:hypothetical protein